MFQALLAAALTAVQIAQIDAATAGVMREHAVHGAAVGIARGGRTLYVHGYGGRSVEPSKPVDAATVFDIGSVTKTFTGALVMQDVERGLVRLDDPVGRMLPGLRDPESAVTIAQLLAQTGGIPSYNGAETNVVSCRTALAAFNGAPLQFPAGSAWAYSNSNYYLLGLALERAGRQPYAALIASRIAQPLHLRSLGYGASSGPDAAIGFENGVPIAAPENALDSLFAAGALHSNAPDLLLWLDALLSGRVVSARSFQTMTTSAVLAGGTPSGYGYGFFIEDWYGLHVAAHPGYVPGFSSYVAIVPERRLEIAILANEGRVDLRALARTVAAIVGGTPDAEHAGAQPAENEDARQTALVRRFLGNRTSALGDLEDVEFISRSQRPPFVDDLYRASFERGIRWAVARFDRSGDLVAFDVRAAAP